MQFVHLADVCEMTTFASDEIYAMEAARLFPKRIEISVGTSVWDLMEVLAWMYNKRSNRECSEALQLGAA